ncbi:MAG: tRNA pseudouridine synthase A [Rhodomicrobium sp.]|nr:MAG: tRNA pseudouridine synthase A [Rhodomicrobium sp.]
MFRYKLTIEYDGTPFVGWQVQKEGLSVQGQIEAALKKLTAEECRPSGSGRTDAGVHALGQVAHIDLLREWETDKIRDGLNFHLRPDPIAIVKAETVSQEFDARFSARQRHYRYLVVNRRPHLTLMKDRAWLVPKQLNVEAMHAAAQDFTGHHDFTTFRSVHCQAKSPLKSLDHFSVAEADGMIRFDCAARSFMHNQVRSMVGSLVQVGLGKWGADGIAKALAAKSRAACGTVAPACGLYFTRVDFDTASL